MRYGHLLAGILLLVFLFFLGLLLIAPPGRKIDVGSATSSPDGGKTEKIAPVYYEKPQFSSVTKVLYTDKGFEPAQVSIPSGGTVAFENRSSSPFWPVSGPQPVYPLLGSCGESAFDPCAPVPAGVSWTFKFDKNGSWTYYDRLNPSSKGVVVVQ